MASTEKILVEIDADLDGLNALIQRVGVLEKNLHEAGQEGGQAFNKTQKEIAQTDAGVKRLNTDTNTLSSTVKNVGVTIAAAFSVAAIASAGKAIFEITARYDTLKTRLTGIEGSNRQAISTLGALNQLAAETPFSVEDLADSYVKLKQRGLDPSIETLRQLGDVAASQSKGFDQLTEAVLDATTGEFERLKEFGIKASKAGDQVTFTFAGQRKVVAFTEVAIKDYIASLSQLPGVMGATAAQSQTLNGRLATLSDNFNQFIVVLGDKLTPVFNALLDGASDLVGFFTDAFGPTLQQKLASTTGAFDGLFGSITSGTLNSQQLQKAVATLNSEYGVYLPKIIAIDAATGKLNITEKEANDIRAVAIKLIREQVFEQAKEKAIADANQKIQKRTTDITEEQFAASAEILRLQDLRAKGQKEIVFAQTEEGKRFESRIDIESAINAQIDKRKKLQAELDGIILNQQKLLNEQVKAIDATVDAANEGLTVSQKQLETDIKTKNTNEQKKKDDLQKAKDDKEAAAKAAIIAEKARQEALKQAKEQIKIDEDIAKARAQLEQDELIRKLKLIDVDIEFTKRQADLEKQQTGALKTQIDERTALQVAGLEIQRAEVRKAISERDTEAIAGLMMPTPEEAKTNIDTLLALQQRLFDASANAIQAQLAKDKAARERAEQELVSAAQRLSAELQNALGVSVPVDKIIADIRTLVAEVEKGAVSATTIAQTVASVGIGISSVVGGILKQQAEADIQAITDRSNAQLALLEENRAKGLITEEQYNAEKEKIQKTAAKKEAEIKKKAAEQQKAISVFQAILNTASAITAALTAGPIAGPILAGIAGALGAAQIALILATPIPKMADGGFIHGASHARGGVQLEAEGGEFIQNKRAVQKYGVKMMESINAGTYRVPSMQPIEFGEHFNAGINYDKLGESVARQLTPLFEGNRQQVTVQADEHGLRTFVRQTGSRSEYINSQYHSH